MIICRRCVVTGHVQGVAYRAHTQHRARELHINGHAKNLADGSVEVLVCGAEPDVAALCDWLWEGPRAARVEAVKCADAPVMQAVGFVTL